MEEPLDVGSNPAAFTSNSHKWIVIKEGQQDWIYSLDQEDPEPPHIKEEQEDPAPPHMKEEQEELWISQEGERLQGLEEAGIKFSFTPVKTEDDEEFAQSSQLHQRQTEQMETEADEEDCGGLEPEILQLYTSSTLHRRYVQQLLWVKEKVIKEEQEELLTSQEGEQLQGLEEAGIKFPFAPVTSDDDEEEEAQFSQSSQTENREAEHLKTESDGEESRSDPDQDCNTGKTSIRSSECAGGFGNKRHLRSESKAVVKPFQCSVCGKRFGTRRALKTHMIVHRVEIPFFSCSVCGKKFARKGNLKKHLTVHPREKPLTCSFCGKTYVKKGHLKRHETIVHVGTKQCSCSVCGKTFARKKKLEDHMIYHPGEKPFRCSVCGVKFTLRQSLKRHVTVHKGKKNI